MTEKYTYYRPDQHSNSAIGGNKRPDLDILVKGNNGEYIITATSLVTDEQVGKLETFDWVISLLQAEGGKRGARSTATELLIELCKMADANAKTLICPAGFVIDDEFLYRFGFIGTADGIRERRPGAALPYSVI